MNSYQRMGSRFLIMVFLVGSCCGAFANGWYSSDWRFRQKITIYTNGVSASLTNFPVLLTQTNVQSGLWSHAQTNGNDILFTLSDNATKLSHEIESYDAATTQLYVWIKLPLLSAAANTSISMYYGNTNANDQQDGTNVWNSDYGAVWHLSEISGTAYDATAYTNNGTPGYLDQDVQGRIDGADEFNGATNNLGSYIQIPDPDDGLDIAAGTSLTMSAWIKTTNAATSRRIISRFDSGWQGYYQMAVSGNKAQMAIRGMTSGETHLSSTNSIDDGAWHYVAGVRDVAQDKLFIYVDGIQDDSATDATVGGLVVDSHFATIGRHYPADNVFDGIIDEIRVSRISRSSEWIATCYTNQVSPSTFSSSLAEQGCPPRGTIITFY